jgi:phage shock protein PspC (stress-responsive transcriptional regulator)
MQPDDQHPENRQPPRNDGEPRDDQTTTQGAPAPRRLFRSRRNRAIGGVAGGLAEYFGIDPIIPRLAFVGLVFAGGAGVLLYIAALLLVPDEADGAAAAQVTPGRTAMIAGVVVLFAAAAILFNGSWWAGGGAVPWIVGLGLLGVGAWWISTGQSAAGSGAEVMRRIGIGLALVALCVLLAAGAFWAAAAGGGAVVAAIVVAAGLAMVGASLKGGARWLILPALAVALPAAFVAAAGIDVHGGMGERTYRPASAAQVRDRYELGMGQLVVDLRQAALPPGDHRMSLRLGAGDAVVVVPDDVCVASTAKVGAGEVRLFDRHEGGVDLDFDERPIAAPSTTRMLVDANLGVGTLQFRHDWPAHPGPGWWDNWGDPTGSNAACRSLA